MFIRPTKNWPLGQTLPVNLCWEDFRDLHALSRKTGKSVRRLVSEAVKATLAEAKEAESFAF
jgi:hypothetical protein